MMMICAKNKCGTLQSPVSEVVERYGIWVINEDF